MIIINPLGIHTTNFKKAVGESGEFDAINLFCCNKHLFRKLRDSYLKLAVDSRLSQILATAGPIAFSKQHLHYSTNTAVIFCLSHGLGKRANPRTRY
ncbi:hypothetical protein CEXT_247501 [Caerostris extrusa]|uniref:Uncharacterized protein n=1 Tax=Caerostris extrusa TaxID=172846 RepID=A0AAV4XU60_CAEEX|nr:hypothetical protein CEXT_247501 [Caerostris extrusa]